MLFLVNSRCRAVAMDQRAVVIISVYRNAGISAA